MRNAIEEPEFVPMARPYAFDIPIYLLMRKRRLRTAPPSQIRLMNGQGQYAPEQCVGGFQEFDPFSNTCANCRVLRSFISRPRAGRFASLLGVSWRALGDQFGTRGAPYPGSPLGINIRNGRARGTKSRLRKLCPRAPLPGQSSTSPLGEVELRFGRGALRNARGAGIRTYGSSVCF